MAITELSQIIEPQFENIPDELKKEKRWVLWSTKKTKDKEGNTVYTKVPKQPTGYNGSATNPDTWHTFDDVLNAYLTKGTFNGVGFMLGDGYIGIDIDNYQDHRDITKEILDTVDSYNEKSVSGTGFHVILKGEIGNGYKKKIKSPADIEIYSEKRFFTVTGHVIEQKPVKQSQDGLQTILDKYMRKDTQRHLQPVTSHTVTDKAEVMRIISASADSDKIMKLMNGDLSMHDNDHSAADMALCNHLAYYTDLNPDLMDEMFRDSKLMRDKWDRKTNDTTYGRITIQNAIDYTVSQGGSYSDHNWEDMLNRVLERDQNGKIISSRFNIRTIFENDPALKGVGRMNVFNNRREIAKQPHWRIENDDEKEWTDTDESFIRIYLSEKYTIESREKVDDALKSMFYEYSYHPIRDYLNSVEWDGELRCETLFCDYLGASDNQYTRDVTRKMFAGAVKRIFNPGIKFDNALILYGKQGSAKSFVLSKLGGEYFNESVDSFSGDEAMMKLLGSWIVELGELSALKNSQVEKVKSFISAKEDTFRPKYERNPRTFKRQCVFFGSTNDYEFLKDKTGNRRFWVVPVDANKRKLNPFDELTDEVVNQLWAEAVQIAKTEKLYLDNEETAKIAEEMQESHTQDDGMKAAIELWLEENNMKAVSARMILHYFNNENPKRHEVKDVNDILRSLDGWEEVKTINDKDFVKQWGRSRGFVKVEKME